MLQDSARYALYLIRGIGIESLRDTHKLGGNKIGIVVWRISISIILKQEEWVVIKC